MMEYIWFWLANELAGLGVVMALFVFYAALMVILEIDVRRREHKRRRGE